MKIEFTITMNGRQRFKLIPETTVEENLLLCFHERHAKVEVSRERFIFLELNEMIVRDNAET